MSYRKREGNKEGGRNLSLEYAEHQDEGQGLEWRAHIAIISVQSSEDQPAVLVFCPCNSESGLS